jgi:hypothetical protein
MINTTPTKVTIKLPYEILQLEAPDDVEKSNGLPPPLTPTESLPLFVVAAFAVDVVEIDVSVVLVSTSSELVNVTRVVVSLALEELLVVSPCGVSVVELSAVLVLVDSGGGGAEELAAGAGAAAVVESPVSNPHNHLSASPMKKWPMTVPPPASCPAQASEILVVNCPSSLKHSCEHCPEPPIPRNMLASQPGRLALYASMQGGGKPTIRCNDCIETSARASGE